VLRLILLPRPLLLVKLARRRFLVNLQELVLLLPIVMVFLLRLLSMGLLLGWLMYVLI